MRDMLIIIDVAIYVVQFNWNTLQVDDICLNEFRISVQK